MQAYSTFFDIEIPSICLADLELQFGVSLDTQVESPFVYPELTPSSCSCEDNHTPTIDDFRPVFSVDDCKICVICRNVLDTPDAVGSYACNHYYHFECIQLWLVKKNSCPLCDVDWKFNSIESITVSFGDEIKNFSMGTTEPDICAYFGVDSSKYKLIKNNKHVEKCTDGAHGLCTIDMHSIQPCVEVSLINSIKSETKKIHAKFSTKIKEFKNDVSHMFGMLIDRIVLVYEGIELNSELDDLNLFNIGISNGSFVTIVPNTKIKFGFDIQNAFVVLYVDSNLISSGEDSVRVILAGNNSWYPIVYRCSAMM